MTLYDKTIGRVTAGFDPAPPTCWWTCTRASAALVTGAQARHTGLALGVRQPAWLMVPLLGPSSFPSPTSRKPRSLQHPGGSSEVTEAGALRWKTILRSSRGALHLSTTINTGNAQGKMYASIYVRLVDRKERTRSVDAMSVKA